MGRGPSTFKKEDVKRALQAAAAAGIEVRRVEIDKEGNIALVIDKAGQNADASNPWEEELAKMEGRKAQ